MNKNFKLYISAWAVLFVLFNIFAFAVPALPGQDKFTPMFWCGYVLITLVFVGQLLCSRAAFQADSAQKLFYNLSLIRISYIDLIVSFIVGGACMILSGFASWIGIIICALVLCINIVSLLKASVAIAEVERIDEKGKTQTMFIRSLTVDAESLMVKAKSDAIKAECRKVYEAVRFSDPMSNGALNGIESEIAKKFAMLSQAVVADDFDTVTVAAIEVCELVASRNVKCKVLK